MAEFLGALLISLCLVPGILLRYTPFAPLVSGRQRGILIFLYTAVSVLNILVMTLALRWKGYGSVFLFLRFDGVIFTVVMAVINILVIPGRWREHLFVFGVVLTCNYLLLAVSTFVMTRLAELDALSLFAIGGGLYLALLLATNYPMRRLLRHTVEPFLGLDSGNYWDTIWSIPIALFLFLFIALGADQRIDSLLQLFSRALYGLVMIQMCLSIAADHKRLQERQAMENQLTAQKLHYAALQGKLEEARKTRHDFKHHVAAIRRYMDMDDKEGLRSYCDELVQRDYSQNIIPYTGNVAVDGVLYHYMQLADRNRVRFDYAGIIHSHGIADIDLSALLGNALDNALAGCLTLSEGRSITLVSQSEKRLLSVMVRNTFDGQVRQAGKEVLSRKRDDRTGVGLSSMRSICQRYGGSMELQRDDKTFTVMFLLPLQENKE